MHFDVDSNLKKKTVHRDEVSGCTIENTNKQYVTLFFLLKQYVTLE